MSDTAHHKAMEMKDSSSKRMMGTKDKMDAKGKMESNDKMDAKGMMESNGKSGDAMGGAMATKDTSAMMGGDKMKSSMGKGDGAMDGAPAKGMKPKQEKQGMAKDTMMVKPR